MARRNLLRSLEMNRRLCRTLVQHKACRHLTWRLISSRAFPSSNSTWLPRISCSRLLRTCRMARRNLPSITQEPASTPDSLIQAALNFLLLPQFPRPKCLDRIVTLSPPPLSQRLRDMSLLHSSRPETHNSLSRSSRLKLSELQLRQQTSFLRQNSPVTHVCC